MLPTKNYTYIIKDHYNKLWYNDTRYLKEYQDLYIVNEDKVEIGDWYIFENKVYRSVINNNSNICKKIIATTDKSLQFNCDGKCAKYECVCLFPQPSDTFIIKYVEEYNKGNIITKVLVEYEEYDNELGCDYDILSHRLKVNTKFKRIKI